MTPRQRYRLMPLQILMRLMLLSSACWLLALLLATILGAAQPGSQLVYSAASSAVQRDLYLLDLRTGLAPQLTRDGTANQLPSVSPDGQQILFHSDRREGGQQLRLYRMQANGRDQRPLLPDAIDTLRQIGTPGQQVAWSPDGRYIANTALRPGQGQRDAMLFILDLSTQQVYQAQPGDTGVVVRWNQPLVWLPDSSGLRWVFVEGVTYNLYQSSPQGPISTVMAGQFAFDELRSFPVLRPQADRFALTARLQDVVSLFAYDAASGQRESLIDGADNAGADNQGTGSIESFAWAGDGQRIAFSSRNGTEQSIGILRPETSEASILLREENTNLSVLSWSPDGRWLLYQQRNSPATRYCLLDMADQSTSCLTELIQNPIWR